MHTCTTQPHSHAFAQPQVPLTFTSQCHQSSLCETALTTNSAGATFTVTSGEGVHVYPARTERTSSGTRSSRLSSRSITTSSDESWSEISEVDEDDIDPSDSASRGQPTSRRHHTEAASAPIRRASSRRVPLPAERERVRHREELPPRRHSSRRQHVSRHDSHDSRTRHRSTSRRVPSDESGSTAASSDDYPPQPLYGPPGYVINRDISIDD